MIEINNLSRTEIPLKKIEIIIKRFLQVYKKENKNISIAFVGDKRMQKLNQQYRNINKITDVLSFAGEGDDLGELVLNYQQIKRQYKRFSQNISEELVFILVHGLLHLLEYKDDTKKGKEEMNKLGKEFIEKYV
ncbi:MAG: rRNA maturation RNase YbeY [Patescibacteria group bacterium]|nr:rRNA maturation RNase YbeY [Patescibacteria group bacterium]